MVIDWSKVDKEDYLLAMGRSPIKDIEIKYVLKNALTDEINNRDIYERHQQQLSLRGVYCIQGRRRVEKNAYI